MIQEQVSRLLEGRPFSLNSNDKREVFKRELQALTQHHYEQCQPYKKILNTLNFELTASLDVPAMPFLPVSLFKYHELSSVPKAEVSATLHSSGTSGNQVSKITLDKNAGILQKKVLAKICSDFLGSERLPMLILDSSSVLKNRAMFSARGAGILGFGILGRDTCYAFDDDMQINFEAVENFIKKYHSQKVFLFGFTFMIWKHFCLPLIEKGLKLDLSGGILIHGGGWKKLENEAVDSTTFKETIRNVSGLTRVHNYYGMAEQTGSIFMECDKGYFHCSDFSDVLVRRSDFSLCSIGEQGMIEVISLLPHSYPGHILLSEDLGEIIGEDDCPCGRLGKYFLVHGRIKNAELRGCSDTYAG